MKPAIYLALFLAQTVSGQQPATTPTEVKSPPHSCVMGDPRESMWAAQSGPKGKPQMSYYEVNDCAWHYGRNPRYVGQKIKKPAVKISTNAATAWQLPFTFTSLVINTVEDPPSCKVGFSWDKDYQVCAKHTIDRYGNDHWIGQDGSGGGVSNPTGIIGPDGKPEMMGIPQPTGPTSITPDGHSIFYAPQEKPLSASATCDPKKNACITAATTITSGNTLTMPENEFMLIGPEIEHGRKFYTLDFNPDWVCALSSNYVPSGNLLYPNTPTLVTLTCVKSDASAEGKAK